MDKPAAGPSPERSFNIFRPEAARAHADALFERQSGAVRSALEKCLHFVPELGNSLMTAVEVYGCVYRVPAHPNQIARGELYAAIESLVGASPSGGLRREQVGDDAIARHSKLFAALYAWGYLQPEEEWNDVIRRVPAAVSTGEAYEADVLKAFYSFLHGSEESGLRFRVGDRQFCFNPAAQGLVARVIAQCTGISPLDICRLDPGQTAKDLLKKYPNLGACDRRPQVVLEAMVAVCGGRQ